METIAAIVRRDFAPIPRPDLVWLEAVLEHSGRSPPRIERYGWLALAYRGGGVAGAGEGLACTQPVLDPGRRHALLFDGRLDNREEILTELGEGASRRAGLDDAEIVHRLMIRRGPEALDRLVGPWALIFVDFEARTVVAARDPIGDRALCWHATPERVAIASEPAHLLSLPGVSGDLDDRTLAAYFAAWTPLPDATFFAAVKQVRAGHLLSVASSRLDSRRFWTPDLEPLRPRDERSCVNLFRSTLETAVEARIRFSDRVAVLMSGGFDSPTIAALTASAIARRPGGGRALPAISWVFDELEEADEREFIVPMLEKYGLRRVWVTADGLWPLKDFEEAPFDPGTPHENVYRELHEGAYAAAAGTGARLLLSGHSADQLFSGVEAYWLRDLAASGQWGQAARCLLDLSRYGRRAWAPLRAATARLVFGSRWSRWRPRKAPSWLTAAARQLLPRQEVLPYERPEHAAALFPSTIAPGMRTEARHAARHGLVLRCPFRDRRVIELALRLPADLLVRPGSRKRLMWLMGDGLLPDPVRNRKRRSTLAPLFHRGVLSHRPAVRSLLIEDAAHLWRPWLKPSFVERMLAPEAKDHASGTDWVVFWRCLCLAKWHLRRQHAP